jgi:hypothetical protein
LHVIYSQQLKILYKFHIQVQEYFLFATCPFLKIISIFRFVMTMLHIYIDLAFPHSVFHFPFCFVFHFIFLFSFLDFLFCKKHMLFHWKTNENTKMNYEIFLLMKVQTHHLPTGSYFINCSLSLSLFLFIV